MVANDIASGKIKTNRKAGLVDMLFSNALKIAYIRDFILGKAKEAVMRQTKGNYPAPLKVGLQKLVVLFHHSILMHCEFSEPP